MSDCLSFYSHHSFTYTHISALLDRTVLDNRIWRSHRCLGNSQPKGSTAFGLEPFLLMPFMILHICLRGTKCCLGRDVLGLLRPTSTNKSSGRYPWRVQSRGRDSDHNHRTNGVEIRIVTSSRLADCSITNNESEHKLGTLEVKQWMDQWTEY
ncbi:hypothetical protein CC79DRAFT_483986 [Sarocladium strictum]